MSQMLTSHFSLEELTHSEIAVRKGLDNTPTPEIEANLAELALALEQVRELLDCPLHISSGYRSAKVNAAVGGTGTSAHCQGYAADFTAPPFGSPKDIAEKIRDSALVWDQLIAEGTWVHISIDPKMRRQVMTAHFAGGKVSYSQGIG